MTKGIGLGVVLKCSTDGSTTFGVTVGQIRRIGGPNASADDVDVSTLDGTIFRQFHKSLVDPGEVTLEVFWDSGLASHIVVHTLLGTTTAAKWQATLQPTTTKEEFSAYVKGVDRDIVVDGAVTGTFTLKLTGNPGYTT